MGLAVTAKLAYAFVPALEHGGKHMRTERKWLRAIRPDVEVIPFDQLDLDSPTLKKTSQGSFRRRSGASPHGRRLIAEEPAMRIAILALLPLALSGCLAKTALDIATLPVKAASKTVDVLTTSQSEADEKRGRAMRKREECMGKEQRRSGRERRDPDFSRCES